MNTSQFMDKQIMDLTSSSSAPSLSTNGKEVIDLMGHSSNGDLTSEIGDDGLADNGLDTKKEEIMASYDFQPIRPTTCLSQSTSSLPEIVNTTRNWGSSDSKPNFSSPIRNYGSLDSLEPAKVILEKDKNVTDAAIISEIDRTMKSHVDNVLHALEGISARLTQLETRSRNLETSVDDLKVVVGNNHGSIDGNMRHVENILREVQTGVQVIKVKQETMEAQFQLAKQKVSNMDQPAENQSSVFGGSITVPPAASAPMQTHQQLSPPGTFPQHLSAPPASFSQHPSVPPPAPTVPPPQTLPQHGVPSPSQQPNQYSSSQIPTFPPRETYFSPPGQTQEAPNQKYHVPPAQQLQQAPGAPSSHQQYQAAAPQPQFSQPPQHAQPSQPHQLQPSLGHHLEEPSYVPSQNYPPNLRQPPSQPPTVTAPSQPYYAGSPHTYDPPSGRTSSGFLPGYGSQPGPTEPYPYGASHSQFGNSTTMKPHQLSSPNMAQNTGSGYPQLPTARALPHALPTSSGVSGGGSGSSQSGNRVPVDDVIDKVASMGFPREHARATVRKLTENGQAVDLNVVLDKLMNDGDIQPQKGWFGR